MNGGQVTLNGITDAQLEALLDVKKNNEGQFQLANLQSLGPPPIPGPCGAWYGPTSPWGMGPGHPGQWFGPGSPFGMQPPSGPPAPSPTPAQSSYNVTLTWTQDSGAKTIAEVFDKLSGA